MMGHVYVGKAGLSCMQQRVIVCVLQTVSQLVLQGENSSVAVVQDEQQQHADTTWWHIMEQLKYLN